MALGLTLGTLVGFGLPPTAPGHVGGLTLTNPFAPEPVSAQTVVTRDLDTIADEVDATGRYFEFASTPDIDTATQQANDAGAAIVWIDSDSIALDDAKEVSDALRDRGSKYDTVLILGTEATYAWSVNRDTAGAAADAARERFGEGDVAGGFTVFTEVLTGSSSAGSSLWWLWLIVVGVAGFFGIRWFMGRRAEAANEAELMELDRQEIIEQVRDNADRVMNLGDQVIAEGDPELLDLYQQASATFQEVSRQAPDATTIEAIDKLDDRMDHAEWQFEVIEARLAGTAPPKQPNTDDPPPPNPSTPPPPSSPANRNPAADPDRPALGPNESVIGGPGGQTSYRRPAQRRSSGGLGGMGGMGGVLGSILIGQATRPRRSTRRSRQRRSTTGSWSGRSGGGVLRGRQRSGRGGGGSFGGSSGGRGGGGTFS